MFVVKKGASIDGLREEIKSTIPTVTAIFETHGVDCVLTSGTEKHKHSVERSAHYRRDAVDYRIKHVPRDARADLVTQIICALGPDFVVIHEGIGTNWEHIHIHWSPIYHE